MLHYQLTDNNTICVSKIRANVIQQLKNNFCCCRKVKQKYCTIMFHPRGSHAKFFDPYMNPATFASIPSGFAGFPWCPSLCRCVMPTHEEMAQLSWAECRIKQEDGTPTKVTHPSTNRARCTATTFIETNTSPLAPNHHRRIIDITD